MKIIKRINIFLINLILILGLCACDKPTTLPLTDEDYDASQNVTTFIYSDTCIISNHNQAAGEITFQNLDTGLRYTLSYNNLTYFNDKYGKSLVAKQVSNGEICDITFDREAKQLKTLDISDKYFTISGVDSFNFYNSATRMEYLGDKYDLDDNVVVCSSKEEISVLEIAEGDSITIHGFDHTIYSITQDNGHGFVSLTNDDYFIGGFIEIGKDIRVITEDMVITVPEGEHSINISKDGSSGVKKVTVGRNQEVELDLSDIEIKELFGNITFTITPSEATLFIDGKRVDNPDRPQRLECGVHEMIVRADGYQTLSRYISVGTMDAELNIKLDKLSDVSDKDKKDDKESSDNQPNSNNNNTNTGTNNDNTTNKPENDTNKDNDSNNKDKQDIDNPGDAIAPPNQYNTKVYIDAPVGAELYLDGNYVGVVPTSFVKTSGSIVITLRKSGCQTRSYTINLEDIQNDSHYTFSELLILTD